MDNIANLDQFKSKKQQEKFAPVHAAARELQAAMQARDEEIANQAHEQFRGALAARDFDALYESLEAYKQTASDDQDRLVTAAYVISLIARDREDYQQLREQMADIIKAICDFNLIQADREDAEEMLL